MVNKFIKKSKDYKVIIKFLDFTNHVYLDEIDKLRY